MSTTVHFGAALGLLMAMAAASAQTRESTIRVDANLVLVPVTVTDRRGATVSGLARENFSIFEEKIAQEIVSFSGQDEPCSVGLVFDISGSMKDKLPAAKAATRSLFLAANAADEAFLLTVSTRPELQSGFTADLGAVQQDVASARAGGKTALIDAVYAALGHMRAARRPRKALVIISDGIDNHSRYTARELMALVMEADVQIYTIAISDAPRYKKPIEMQDERRGMFLLDGLAERTGGLHFTLANLDQIAEVARKIGTALRHQYVIGYRPAAHPEPGKWRKIQVRANVPNVRLYARTGYYAPASRSAAVAR